jgi:hypothetical protein
LGIENWELGIENGELGIENGELGMDLKNGESTIKGVAAD